MVPQVGNVAFQGCIDLGLYFLQSRLLGGFPYFLPVYFYWVCIELWNWFNMICCQPPAAHWVIEIPPFPFLGEQGSQGHFTFLIFSCLLVWNQSYLANRCGKANSVLVTNVCNKSARFVFQFIPQNTTSVWKYSTPITPFCRGQAAPQMPYHK